MAVHPKPSPRPKESHHGPLRGSGGLLEWKGCQGLDRKPHAERRAKPEHRTGEDRGEANP